MKNQQKRQLNQLNEAFSLVASSTNVDLIENETLKSLTDDHYNSPEKIIDGEITACQIQVLGKDIDDKIRKAVDKAVITVENCIHDAILTAMHNVVIPRVEMAERSITSSSGPVQSKNLIERIS